MFLRSKPTLSYSGLTIVLSNASRFDKVRLLTAGGGHILNDFCLRPELNQMQCDIRVADDKSPWLNNTKCVLLLGEYAMHTYLPQTRNNTLNEMRGTLFDINGLPCIASFYPQDAADPKNFEAQFNKEHKVFEDEDEGGDEDDDGKTHGRTKRKNYAFWMRADLKKCKYILKNGLPKLESQPEYVNYANVKDLCNVLDTHKDEFLDFDIETDYEEQNMQCFSFTFDNKTVFNVPVLDFNYQPALSGLPFLMRSLAGAIKRNILVCHNGATFDFIVLGYKYRIPVYRVYDTLAAMHRCFPTIEKSLGHCLTGDTLIDTLCGKVPIKDLVGKENFHVWSWKYENPFPSKVKKVFKTRENADLVRVHIWRKTNDGNGMFYEKTHIDCTPDHLFLLNEKWVRADSLVNGDKLTRVRISYGKFYKSYDRIVYKNIYGVDVRERVHKYVYESLYGKLEKDFVHHKDEDKWNNEPDNLQQLTEQQHNSLHMSLNIKRNDMTSYVPGTFKNGITNDWDVLDKETLEKLYTSGMSQAEIAKVYGSTQASIRLLMVKHGIKARKPHEGQKIYYAKNKNCTVLGVEFLKEKQDVYCMEVEGTECFSANNVIVHNCVSYWTWQPFHKDEDSRGYRTQQQMSDRMRYCGKDVFTMSLVRKAITSYSKTVVGLEHSIQTVMDSIVPYVTTALQGIKVDEELRQKMRYENDRLMEQYLRMIRILIGEAGLEEVQKCIKGKAGALPGSNKQCVEYFHNILGYPIVHRSKPDQHGVRNPSLAKQAMYKLRLKHENPVIDLCNIYRGVKLETTTPLGFYPWKDDNNKINYATT